MATLKERFNAKFPLADYEAVYTQLMRDNIESYEKARNLEKSGIPYQPFSCFEKADKTYVGSYVTVAFLSYLSNYKRDFNLGFDKARNLFYVYIPKFVFLYDSLEEYVEMLIERLIA